MGFRSISIMATAALLAAGCAMPIPLKRTSSGAIAVTAAPALTTSQPCAAGLSKISIQQTAVPLPKLSPTPLPPNYTPGPKPPTATPGPAPSIDRVGFPKGYLDTFKLMYVYDRPDNKQVRVVCGNDAAAAWSPNAPFAYGSVIAMTTYRAREENGVPLKDANGHFIMDVPTGVLVMRKEKGYGESYAQLRTGEWEYASYRTNGAPQMPPQGTYACAVCHLALASAEPSHDWTFRASAMFDSGHYLTHASPISNEVLISSMALFPRSMKVTAGSTITWTNGDTFEQTLKAKDGSFPATTLKPGAQFSFQLNKPGRFEFSVSDAPHQLIGAIQVTK